MKLKMILLLILPLLLFTGCNQEGEISTEDLDIKIAEAEKKGDAYVLKCELGELKKKKCLLPEVGEMKKPRILSILSIEDKGQKDCVLGKNLRVLGNHRGLHIRRGCEGHFKVALAKGLKTLKYGSKLEWNNVKALDFGHAILNNNQFEFSDEGELAVASNGIGVKGGVHAPDQINHDPVTGESQSLLFELPKKTLGLNLVVSNLYKNEGSGERGIIYILNKDKEVIAKKVIGPKMKKYKSEDQNHVGQVKLRGLFGAKYALVQALPYVDGSGRPDTDSGDFFVRYLNVKVAK